MYGGHSGGRGWGGRAGSEPAATEGSAAVALKSQGANRVDAVLERCSTLAVMAQVVIIERRGKDGRVLFLRGRWGNQASFHGLLEQLHSYIISSLVVKPARGAPRDDDSTRHRLYLRQKYKPNFQKSQW